MFLDTDLSASDMEGFETKLFDFSLPLMRTCSLMAAFDSLAACAAA